MKKSKKLILVFAIFIVLVAAYIALTKIKDKDEKQQNTTVDNQPTIEDKITLYELDYTQISSMKVHNENGEFTFSYKDGVWVYEEDNQVPLNQTQLETMAKTISSVVAKQIVEENAQDLSMYGLSNPKISVTVSISTGEEKTLNIGDTAIEQMRYIAEKGSNKVYITKTDFEYRFNFTLTDIIEVASWPKITDSGLSYIKIAQSGKEAIELFHEGDDGDKSDFSDWYIIKPYQQTYGVSGASITELVNKLSSMFLYQCVDISPEDLSVYGLDEPILEFEAKYYTTTDDGVVTQEENTIHLMFGSQNEDEYYYVKLSDKDSVYTIPAADVEGLLGLKPFDFYNKYLTLIGIDTVDKLEIELDGKTYTYEIKRASSDSAQDAIYYFDGKVVTEDVFKGFYSEIVKLMADGEIPDAPVDVKPYLTLRFTRNTEFNPEIIVEFTQYDSGYYQATYQGISEFLISKQQVEAFVKQIQDFVTNN